MLTTSLVHRGSCPAAPAAARQHWEGKASEDFQAGDLRVQLTTSTTRAGISCPPERRRSPTTAIAGVLPHSCEDYLHAALRLGQRDLTILPPMTPTPGNARFGEPARTDEPILLDQAGQPSLRLSDLSRPLSLIPTLCCADI